MALIGGMIIPMFANTVTANVDVEYQPWDFRYTYRIINGGTEVEFTRYIPLTTSSYCILPAYVDGLPVTSIGGYIDSRSGLYIGAFQGVTSLVSVSLEVITSIGNSAFAGCTSLRTIDWSGNNLVSIGDYAFSGCTALQGNSDQPIGHQGLIIPREVTHVGQGAFSGCTSLINASIPQSLVSLPNSMFAQCSSLVKIRLDGNAPTCGLNWIAGHGSSLVIYYPTGTTGYANPWQGVSTVSAARPSAPQNLVATAGDGQVTLHWDAPLTEWGSIDYPSIDYYAVYMDGELWENWHYWYYPTITDLTNGKEYEFTVTAHGVGDGASSSASASPKAPTNFTMILGGGLAVLAIVVVVVLVFLRKRKNNNSQAKSPQIKPIEDSAPMPPRAINETEHNETVRSNEPRPPEGIRDQGPSSPLASNSLPKQCPMCHLNMYLDVDECPKCHYKLK